jgi:hypothetical protein
MIAAVGALRADAPVSVRTPDLSSLLARRSETGALQGDLAPTERPTTGPPAKSAAKVAAKATPPAPANRGPWQPIAAGLGGLVAVVAVVWLVWSRRSRGQSAVADAIRASNRPPAPTTATSPGTSPSASPSASPEEPWICPTCRVGYPRATGNCPKDGTALVPYRQFAESRRSLQPAAGKRCPRCGRLYADSAAFCSEDGAPLA